MTYREWRDDLIRREAAKTAGCAVVLWVDPERRYALNGEDCQILRKMDAAFQERV